MYGAGGNSGNRNEGAGGSDRNPRNQIAQMEENVELLNMMRASIDITLEL
jgi:hypothetical protein